MCNKSPPKLARKYLPYKNRVPPAPEVNLCSELTMFCGVYYCLIHLLSVFYKPCVFGLILCLQSPRTWLPVPTCDSLACSRLLQWHSPRGCQQCSCFGHMATERECAPHGVSALPGGQESLVILEPIPPAASPVAARSTWLCAPG